MNLNKISYLNYENCTKCKEPRVECTVNLFSSVQYAIY